MTFVFWALNFRKEFLHGLYPSWDAANRESVALAEKLSYHFDREYTAYQVKHI